MARHVLQGVSHVGRAHAGKRRQQRVGALVGFRDGQAVDLVPLDLAHLSATPGQSRRGGADRQPREHPVTDAVLLHAEVDDHDPLPGVAQGHSAVEQLGEYERLVAAALETLHD